MLVFLILGPGAGQPGHFVFFNVQLLSKKAIRNTCFLKKYITKQPGAGPKNQKNKYSDLIGKDKLSLL